MNDVRINGIVAKGLLLCILTYTHPSALSNVDIRGRVTHISRSEPGSNNKKILGRVRIEGIKETDTRFDKADVTVTTKTKIFRRQANKREQVTFNELKEGINVEARFVGPLMESYPVQTKAAEIVIIED